MKGWQDKNREMLDLNISELGKIEDENIYIVSNQDINKHHQWGEKQRDNNFNK